MNRMVFYGSASTTGLGITVSHGAIKMLMKRAGITGLPGV
jgi:hypothetical protein